jgi:hypothetical protein
MYTMAQMVSILNEHPNVTFKEVTADDFYDYGELFDHYYRSFPVVPSKKTMFFRLIV